MLVFGFVAVLLAGSISVASGDEQLYQVPYLEYTTRAGENVDYILGGFNGESFGYIDETGELAIEPLFRDAGPFSDGHAAVQVSKGYFMYSSREHSEHLLMDWGYMTEGGQLLDRYNWGYIDKTGSLVIPPQFKSASAFSEGLALVGYRSDGKTYGPLTYGFIDESGWIAFEIAEDIKPISGFHDGRATVVKELRFNRKHYAAIDTSGDIVIDWSERNTGRFAFREGLIPFTTDSNGFGGYGFMDTSGETVIEPRYLLPRLTFAGETTFPWDGYGFSEGLAAVGVRPTGGEGPEWYFINRENERVLGPYGYCYSFSEGLALVLTTEGE